MTSLMGGDVAAQTWNGNPSSKVARLDTTVPSTEDYVNVFGPSAYNITPDTNRNKKYSRLHLPDVLKVRLSLHCHPPLKLVPLLSLRVHSTVCCTLAS